MKMMMMMRMIQGLISFSTTIVLLGQGSPQILMQSSVGTFLLRRKDKNARPVGRNLSSLPLSNGGQGLN